MADAVPASVAAMAADPKAPTAPLEDFLRAMAFDDNWWWRIECGHHLNLFEAALERCQEAVDRWILTQAELDRVTAMYGDA